MKRLPTRQEELLIMSARGKFSPIWRRVNDRGAVYYSVILTGNKVTASVKALMGHDYVEQGPWDHVFGNHRVVATGLGREYLEYFGLDLKRTQG